MKIILSPLTHLLLGGLIVIIGAYLKIQGYNTSLLLVGIIIEIIAVIEFLYQRFKK